MKLFSYAGHHRVSKETELCLTMAGVKLLQEDFDKALDTMQAAHSDTIGAPKVVH